MKSRANKIRVLAKAPKCPAYVHYTNGDLESLQNLVGGYIETVTFDEFCVICDEEGRLKNRKTNCEINGVDFVGKIAILGINGDEFDNFIPTKEFKEKYPQIWEK